MSSFAFAAAPQVQETLVGPTNVGGAFALSPRGANVAYVGMKEKSFVVNVNGIDGPAFDELYLTQQGIFHFPQRAGVWGSTQGGMAGGDIPVIFSADGAHHAYVGRQGNEYVVIYDGKELARGPKEKLARGGGPLTISPAGKIVFWAESEFVNGRTNIRRMVHGKPGPWSTPDGTAWSPVFSADESRVAFSVAQVLESGKPALIVDGNDAGYVGGDAVFTADGQVLLSRSFGGGGASVLADGKPVITGVQVTKLVAGPVGHTYAAIVRQLIQNKPVDLLYVDGKQVPGSEHAQDVWFSPDGKRYAAVCSNPMGGPFAMVVDGKRSAEYTGIDARPPFWSPDGSKIVFTAAKGAEAVVVVEGQEFPYSGALLGQRNFVFGERGNRLGWGTRAGNNRIFTLTVDGQSVLPAGVYPVDDSLTFSPDGSRHAFLVGPIGRGEITGIVVDGETKAGLAPGSFGKWATRDPQQSFAFSGDSKHVAYIARGADPKSNGLYVDGKLVYPTARAVFFPTFTPDGNHLFWAADEAPQGRNGPPSLVVYADGKPVVRASNAYFFQQLPGTWDMGRDGTLTFLGADGDAAKRYRIPAPSDTDVAALLASGAVVAAAPAAPPSPTEKPAVPKPTAPAAPVPAAAPGVAGEAVEVLTWATLLRRIEARPASCTLNRDFKFQGGATVRAGTKVNILEIKANEMVVATPDGRTTFGVKPQETDALDVARAAWTQLTPEQRELTYPALMQRTELWPYRVKLALPFELEGRKLKIGDSVLLLKLEGNDLLVRLDGTDVAFNVKPQETDLMAQARGFLASEQGAPGRLLEEFAGKLVDPTTGQRVALKPDARPKYVVLYMGAGWCAPCKAFAPQLVKVVKEELPKPDDVAVFFLSGDKTPADAKAYATNLGIAWPTLSFTNRGQLPAFQTLFGDSIPQVVVTDRHGKVLIDSAKTGTDRALEQLRGLR